MRFLTNSGKLDNTVKNFLKKQVVFYDKLRYRLSIYTFITQIKDDVIIYNTMTSYAIVISRGDYEAITYNNLQNENPFLYDFLIQNWFLVPIDFDEKTSVDILRNIIYNNSFTYKNPGYLNSYTILTTTECNARCPYCYEAGYKHVRMTEKVAADVVKFIINCTKGIERVHINWFGGEPTYNMDAIKKICSELKFYGKKINSAMTSNGYLLNKENVDYLKDEANLTNVQITLDGINEVHNKIKDFIYKDDPNPFDTIIDNIRYLLEKEIYVSIRLNVGLYNKEDMLNVVDYFNIILPTLKNTKYLSIYSHIVFESADNQYTEDEKNRLYKNEIEVSNRIYNLIPDLVGFRAINKDLSKMKSAACMVDNNSSIVITPEGYLSKCEHYLDDGFIGSIYSNYLDRDHNRKFDWRRKRNKADLAKCKTCILYPRCFDAKECGGVELCCDSYRAYITSRIKQTLKIIYDKTMKESYKPFRYTYQLKTNDISNLDIVDCIRTINMSGDDDIVKKYYILADSIVHGNQYIAVTPEHINKGDDLVLIFKYDIIDGEISNIRYPDSLEESLVLYDYFNEIIDDRIINVIRQFDEAENDPKSNKKGE